MTAIAGIQSPHGQNIVKEMLGQMKHRGNDWCQIIEKNAAILGASGTKNQKKLARKIQNEQVALEFVSRNHYAAAKITKDDIELSRDSLGISPLYYGRTTQGALCFASEVKGLLAVTRDVHELPPGYSLIGTQLKRTRRPARNGSKNRPYDEIARELRDKLEAAVRNRIGEEYAGAWLSGGIDSSAISAIARPHLKEFHTFTAGLPGSQDVRYAQVASKHIGSIHHTRTVTVEEIIQAIPEVIYHMESFDALLIRSSILNFLVANTPPISFQPYFQAKAQMSSSQDTTIFIKSQKTGFRMNSTISSVDCTTQPCSGLTGAHPLTGWSLTWQYSTRKSSILRERSRLNTKSGMGSKNGSCGKRWRICCRRNFSCEKRQNSGREVA